MVSIMFQSQKLQQHFIHWFDHSSSCVHISHHHEITYQGIYPFNPRMCKTSLSKTMKNYFLFNNTIHKNWHSITTRSPQLDFNWGDLCHVCNHWSIVVKNPWAKVHLCWIEETMIQNYGMSHFGFYYVPITKVAAELHSLIWSILFMDS